MKKAYLSFLCSVGLIFFSNSGGRSKGLAALLGSEVLTVLGPSQVSLRLSMLVSFYLLRIQTGNCLRLLLQMMNQCKKAVFFKEYPCYHFALYDLAEARIQSSFSCLLRNSFNKLQSNPPAAIADTYSPTEVLYLLQWHSSGQQLRLLVRQLEDQDWIQIKMNLFPDHITISSGTIFIISGTQLFIITPKYCRKDRYDMPSGPIISVHPCVYDSPSEDSDNSGTVIYEPGIYILFQSEKKSYFAGQYSSNHYKLKKPHLLSQISELVQGKQRKYLHLEVIIPNLLGLAFLEDETIGLFNLATMELVKGVSTQFVVRTGVQDRPVVRWRRHEMANYDETFLILVGAGPFIFSFFLMINYKPTAQHLNLRPVPLADFVVIDVIQWSQLSLKPYLTFALEGKLLIDFTISKKGLIYLSKNSPSDLVGECKYIDMNHLLNEYPIITQEMTIWKLHYQDLREEYRVDFDRLLIPNRYPYSLVQHLRSTLSETHQLNDSALSLWRHHYGFKSFTAFDEEILIIRGGSISVFRNIQKELFEQEYLSYRQLQALQPWYIHQRFKNLTSEGHSRDQGFQESALEVSQSIPLIVERSYKVFGQSERDSEEHLEIQIRNELFRSNLRELEQIIIEQHQHLYHSLRTPKLQRRLICHQVKDRLSYFCLVFGSNVYHPQDQRERQFNKLYEKNSFIAQVFRYFHSLSHRAAEHHRTLGHSLVDLFVQQCQHQVSDDINASVHIVMQKLLANLLPQEIDRQQSSLIEPHLASRYYRLYANDYLDFLVRQLQLRADQKQHEAVSVLRLELTQVINIGFFSHKSIFFSQLWSNTSLFKILLLSNQIELVRSVFPQYLLLAQNGSDVHLHYPSVKKYMTTSCIEAVERQLFVNQANHDLKTDISYLNFENWIDQESNVEVAAIFQSIHEDILERELLQEKALAKIDNLEAIRELFNDLQGQEQPDSEAFREIQCLISSATIPNLEEKLQFYEELLLALVKLFNHRVDKDHNLKYYNQENASSVELTQFQDSRGILKSIIESINSSFSEYKNIYNQVFGHQINKTLREKVKFEETLMTKLFIDQPIRLISSHQGLIVSRLSLKLIEMALAYSPARSEEEYHLSLKEIPNLLCFWFKNLKHVPLHEVAFTYEYLSQFDSNRIIENYLKLMDCSSYIESLGRAKEERSDKEIHDIVWEIFAYN